MVFALDIDVDAFTAFGDQLARLDKRRQDRAIASAVNDTARQAQRHAASAIAKAAGLKVGAVRKDLALTRARPGTPRAMISARGETLPLIAFRARQTKKGVSARAWGKRKLYPGTFIMRMPSGHRGVFVRVGSEPPYRGTPRRVKTGKTAGRLYRPGLKIREVHGVSIPKTFAEPRIADAVRTHASERLHVNLARQIDRQLRAASGAARLTARARRRDRHA